MKSRGNISTLRGWDEIYFSAPHAVLSFLGRLQMIQKMMEQCVYLRRGARSWGAARGARSSQRAVAPGCDVILVNADGRVVESGNHSELMALKGLDAEDAVCWRRDAVQGVQKGNTIRKQAKKTIKQTQKVSPFVEE